MTKNDQAKKVSKVKTTAIKNPAKKADRAAEDAAQRAGRTEEKYEEKRGIFTK